MNCRKNQILLAKLVSMINGLGCSSWYGAINHVLTLFFLINRVKIMPIKRRIFAYSKRLHLRLLDTSHKNKTIALKSLPLSDPPEAQKGWTFTIKLLRILIYICLVGTEVCVNNHFYTTYPFPDLLFQHMGDFPG